MTPYRDRREKGHYNPDGLPPESTHSHHLVGLATAPPMTTAAASPKKTAAANTAKPKKRK